MCRIQIKKEIKIQNVLARIKKKDAGKPEFLANGWSVPFLS
jgi:hypothetical protein